MEYFWTFLVGGGLCLVGQILMDSTTLTTPRVLVLFVVAGVILEAVGIYEPLVNLAGTGATVPLTGFGYNLAKGAIEGAGQGFIPAIIGPVKNAAAGIGFAIAFGYIVSLIFSPKSPKR